MNGYVSTNYLATSSDILIHCKLATMYICLAMCIPPFVNVRSNETYIKSNYNYSNSGQDDDCSQVNRTMIYTWLTNNA